MRQLRSKAILIGVLTFMLCSGFVCTGSQIHKATLAEHDFKVAIQGFQNAELAEFQAGHVDPATHREIAEYVTQVAQAGVQLTTLIQQSNTAGALAQVNNVNVAIQTLLNQGVLHISNATTKASLQVALEAVQAIITNIQMALS